MSVSLGLSLSLSNTAGHAHRNKAGAVRGAARLGWMAGWDLEEANQEAAIMQIK